MKICKKESSTPFYFLSAVTSEDFCFSSYVSYSIFTVIRSLEKPWIPDPVLSLAACGQQASPMVKTCFVCPPPDEIRDG